MEENASPPALVPALGPAPCPGAPPPAATIYRARGRLRHGASPLVAARDDLEAVQLWLQEYRGQGYSPHTFHAARREAERLVLWAGRERGKPISDLTREDFLAYEAFLGDPQPSAVWCGPRHPRGHQEWRPFLGPLAASSKRQAIVILKSMYAYLVNAQYLVANPLALKRHPRPPQGSAVERVLDPAMWSAVTAHVEGWPRESRPARFHYERARFILSLLYLVGPRLSDLPSHTMGDFQFRKTADGGAGWWWAMTGKGGVKKTVPVNNDMMRALRRWRVCLGEPELPGVRDPAPVVRAVGGTRGIGANAVYRIVKSIMRGAADEIEATDPGRAAILRQASPHWLRHTAITAWLDSGVELRYARDSARHKSISTTADVYSHSGDGQWHQAMEAHRLGWP